MFTITGAFFLILLAVYAARSLLPWLSGSPFQIKRHTGLEIAILALLAVTLIGSMIEVGTYGGSDAVDRP